MAFWSRKPKPAARDEPPENIRLQEGRRSSDYFLSASEAIAAAASRIAGTMAASPLGLYLHNTRQLGNGLDRLISYAPGPGMTGYGFVRDMELYRNTQGRAYAWIVRGEDLVSASRLMILDPARVTALRAVETGDMWYQCLLDDGRQCYIPDCDMIALPFLSGGRGARPVDILRGTMQYDADIKDFSVSQLHGVNDTLVITVPTDQGAAARKRIVEDILASYRESGKSALLLEGGATASRIAGSPVDPKVLDVERVTKTRVATVYGIPPHLLGAAENTRGSAEEEMEEYLALGILPAMALWESELNKKLLTYAQLCKGYSFRFDRDALSQANTAAKAEKYHKAVRGGWMTLNEVRAKEGLPAIENGDVPLVSRDLLPLSINTLQPELLITGGRGKTNEE